MNSVKLSVAEIIEIAKAAKEQGIDSGLPRSKPGVADRAERQKWKFEIVAARGGKDGVKKVYTLPMEVIEELERKGLSHLIEGHTSSTPVPFYSATSISGVPESMQAAVQNYTMWANEQDRSSVVPIRYYRHVYASAGAGEIAWDTSCDVMWFRTSFINYLGCDAAHLFCTRIKGDSMFPTLIDGGTALWRTCTEYEGEGIYILRQFNEIRVKRLVRHNRHSFHIISDNDNKSIYPTETLDLSEYEPHEFELYGKYLWDCGISDHSISESVTIP